MTVAEVVQDFNYEALDLETRVVVQQRRSEIQSLMNRAAQTTVEIGQKLIEVKCRLGHKRFLNWIDTEFEWSDRTAERYMLVAKKFATVSNIENFGASALYLLAESATPEPVVETMLTQGEQGEQITKKKVQAAIAAAKLEPGEQHTVTEKESPYYGQSVKVDRSEGEFVYCETPDGKTTPLLPGWLGEQLPEKTKPEPKPDQKTELLVSLEFKVGVKDERIKLLEKWMSRAMNEGRLPQDLYLEGQELLGWAS